MSDALTESERSIVKLAFSIMGKAGGRAGKGWVKSRSREHYVAAANKRWAARRAAGLVKRPGMYRPKPKVRHEAEQFPLPGVPQK